MSKIVQAEKVIRGIKRLSARIWHDRISRRDFHAAMQRAIARMARGFGLRGNVEYPVTTHGGRRGLVDVVWLSDLRPVAAFEIDGSLRRKSIDKLLTLQAPFRFWVYYGAKEAVFSFVQDADPNGRIHLVRLERMHLGGSGI